MGVKTDTRGASVLERHHSPRRVSFAYMQQGLSCHDRPPFESAGSPSNTQRMRASSGSAPAAAKMTWLLPESHESVEKKFRRLSNEWKRDTGHLSMASRMVAHPSYLSIVAMGEPAIPLILRDLEREPNHWFSALAAIAGEGPKIPTQDRGDMRKISKAWLEWGESKNYIE